MLTDLISKERIIKRTFKSKTEGEKSRERRRKDGEMVLIKGSLAPWDLNPHEGERSVWSRGNRNDLV